MALVNLFNTEAYAKLTGKSKDFIDLVYGTAEKNKVEIKVSSGKTLAGVLNDPHPPKGYFIEYPSTKKKQLYFSIGCPQSEWLSILAHESSHMDQCLNGVRAWVESTFFKGEDVYTLLDNWVERRVSLTQDESNELVKRIIWGELDCERRTLKKIEKYELPIDINSYIKKANSYLFYYVHIKETRAWVNSGAKGEVYTVRKVWNKAPDKMLRLRQYHKVPEALKQAFFKHYG